MKSFLDQLASHMDHNVSQQCQIYQLEDVPIKAWETLDELVDHLRALANRCNFQTDRKWNKTSNSVQSMPSQTMSWSRNCSPLTSRPQQPRCSKHAGLTKPQQTTSMLWASDPKLSMLSTNGTNNLSLTHKNSNQKSNPQNQHSCGNCTKSHAPGRASFLAKDSTCWSCGRIDHWDIRC